MFREFARRCAELFHRADYLATSTRLRILHWIAGPLPEPPIDRTIRDRRECLRQAFSQVDFDDSTVWTRDSNGVSQSDRR
jgi:hypothetical protein